MVVMKIGDKYGLLQVTKLLGRREYYGRHRPFVEVKCECGFVYELAAMELQKKRGRKSCKNCAGKSKRLCNPGDRFDKLTVKSYVVTGAGRRMACCVCDCGNEVVVRPELLVKNLTNNCGCSPRGKWQGFGEISGTFFYRIKRNASMRDLEFNVTKEELWALFEAQKRKCALSGSSIVFSRDEQKTSASLDRIDSNGPYVISNVQWVHKDINKMKMDLTQSKFIEWCKKITEYQDEFQSN